MRDQPPHALVRLGRVGLGQVLPQGLQFLSTERGGGGLADRGSRPRRQEQNKRDGQHDQYTAPGGTRVALGQALEQARAATIHYAPRSFAEVFRRRDAMLHAWPRAVTAFAIVQCTTLAATRNLFVPDGSAEVLALNFA